MNNLEIWLNNFRAFSSQSIKDIFEVRNISLTMDNVKEFLKNKNDFEFYRDVPSDLGEYNVEKLYTYNKVKIDLTIDTCKSLIFKGGILPKCINCEYLTLDGNCDLSNLAYYTKLKELTIHQLDGDIDFTNLKSIKTLYISSTKLTIENLAQITNINFDKAIFNNCDIDIWSANYMSMKGRNIIIAQPIISKSFLNQMRKLRDKKQIKIETYGK